jgi:hypothetical protein
MLDFLEKTKEWLFSGAGVAIIVALVAIVRSRFSHARHSTQTVVVKLETSQAPTTPLSAGTGPQIPVHRIAPVTFLQIHEALRGAPPLQREELRKHYVGLYVEWDAYLADATKEKNDTVRLRLKPAKSSTAPGGLLTIRCRVALRDYQELAILKEGAPIRLFGRIAEADDWDVELTEAQLTFKAPQT